MAPADYISLPFNVQLSLVCGYLGYNIAYAGIRRHHTATDVVFLTLAFGLIAWLTKISLDSTLSDPSRYSVAALVAVTLLSTAICAGVWRALARALSFRILEKLGLHSDDGLFHGWDTLIQGNNPVSQISVHTKDGRILFLSDRRRYVNGPHRGLILGGDGSVTMIVEKEELPGGAVEHREDIVSEESGTRLTYIPAGEIIRVNIRMTGK